MEWHFHVYYSYYDNIGYVMVMMMLMVEDMLLYLYMHLRSSQQQANILIRNFKWYEANKRLRFQVNFVDGKNWSGNDCL